MDKTGRAPGSPMEPELQEFHTGAAVHAYRTFGCHALPGAAGHRFAVWAPHAQRVALVGDFNGWDAAATPMDRLPDGTWVQTVDGLRDGALYKYAVTGPDGQTVLKADPFAAHCETGPATASKVWPLEGYEAGKPQPSYDKQFVRDWLKANPDSDYKLPQDVIDKTIAKYVEAYKMITGKDLD